MAEKSQEENQEKRLGGAAIGTFVKDGTGRKSGGRDSLRTNDELEDEEFSVKFGKGKIVLEIVER